MAEMTRTELLAEVVAERFGPPPPTPPTPLIVPAYQRRRRPHDRERLTRRELQVLRRVALGCPNSAIGLDLSMSSGAVQDHLTAIYDKLGAHNRTHAVALAFRGGLLDRGD